LGGLSIFVIPAQAGIHSVFVRFLDARLRGHDDFIRMVITAVSVIPYFSHIIPHSSLDFGLHVAHNLLVSSLLIGSINETE